METFPLPYSFRDGIKEEIAYATTEVVFASGKKQVQRHAVNPMKKYKIVVKGTPEQRQTLVDFHKKMGGNTGVFLFVNPEGTTVNCRFSGGSLNIENITDYDPTNTVTFEKIVGFTAEASVETAL
jgi:phage-related protein